MKPIDDAAEKAIDDYLYGVRRTIRNAADAVAPHTVSLSHVEWAIRRLPNLPSPPKQMSSFWWWLVGQAGAIMAGGAGGELFSSPSEPTPLWIMLACGLCLIVASRLAEIQR